jgi:hypothetical protein
MQTQADEERWLISLQREQAEKLGMLKDFEHHAAQGTLRDFQRTLNYVQLRKDSEFNIRLAKISFFAFGLLVGFFSGNYYLTIMDNVWVLIGVILAAMLLGGLFNAAKDIYKKLRRNEHTKASSMILCLILLATPFVSFGIFMLFIVKIADLSIWIFLPLCILGTFIIYIFPLGSIGKLLDKPSKRTRP